MVADAVPVRFFFVTLTCTLAKTQRAPRDAEMAEDEIGKVVFDVAVAIHREVDPGLLETVYDVSLALAHEL